MDTVWIDISSLRQANLLSTLLYKISKELEVIVTASRSPALARVLSGNGIGFSQYNGTAYHDGFGHYGERILALTDFVKGRKPDLLISDLDPAAVRTAFGLGIPVWTFFQEPVNPERHKIQEMALPLCEKVFVSERFPDDQLASFGLIKDQIEPFRGWNECYLLEKPWQDMATSLESDNCGPSILLRPRGTLDQAWVDKTAQMLRMGQTSVVTQVRSQGDGSSSSDGTQPVSVDPPPLFHDLYVGSGRMAAEFFVLGKPLILLPDHKYGDLRTLYRQVLESDDENDLKAAVSSLLGERGRTSLSQRCHKVTRHMRSPISVVAEFMGSPFSGYKA